MQGNTHLHSRYRPHMTASMASEVYRGNRHYNVCEQVGLDTNQSLHHPPERDQVVRCTYVRTYNVMSQLSDWKRAHMCTENHVCFGRIHGKPVERVHLGNTRTYTCTNITLSEKRLEIQAQYRGSSYGIA